MADSSAGRKGVFEAFRSSWLLQVAGDREAKAAMPVAVILAVAHLNRETGKAWPGIERLTKATGAASQNTVRTALKTLEARGHAAIEWSDGGKNRTHIVTPLVDGKPFRKLKGIELSSSAPNPSTFEAETLQVSDAKPFKKLNPNHLKEPLDVEGAAHAAPPQYEENVSSSEGSACADPPATGEKGDERKPDHLGSLISSCLADDDLYDAGETDLIAALAERHREGLPISAADLKQLQHIRQAQVARLPPPDALEFEDGERWADDPPTSQTMRTR